MTCNPCPFWGNRGGMFPGTSPTAAPPTPDAPTPRPRPPAHTHLSPGNVISTPKPQPGPAPSPAASRAGEGRHGRPRVRGPWVSTAPGCGGDSSEAPARCLIHRCSARSRCGAQACNWRLMTGPRGRTICVLVPRDRPPLPRDPRAMPPSRVGKGRLQPRAGSSLSGCRVTAAVGRALPRKGTGAHADAGSAEVTRGHLPARDPASAPREPTAPRSVFTPLSP